MRKLTILLLPCCLPPLARLVRAEAFVDSAGRRLELDEQALAALLPPSPR
jgi:hypothetical protein